MKTLPRIIPPRWPDAMPAMIVGIITDNLYCIRDAVGAVLAVRADQLDEAGLLALCGGDREALATHFPAPCGAGFDVAAAAASLDCWCTVAHFVPHPGRVLTLPKPRRSRPK